jgi:hypothetical protein
MKKITKALNTIYNIGTKSISEQKIDIEKKIKRYELINNFKYKNLIIQFYNFLYIYNNGYIYNKRLS